MIGSPRHSGALAMTESNLVLKVTRQFDLPPEQVFDAWLNQDNIGRWLFATPGGQMLRVEIDPHVGGGFTIVEKRGDQLAEHFGTYLIIERPRKLSFHFATDRTSTPSLVTIELVSTSAGCDLTLTHEIEAKWAEYRDRVQSGWTKILEGLSGMTFHN